MPGMGKGMRRKHFIGSLLFVIFCSLAVLIQAAGNRSPSTKLVLLGTGNPNPDPHRSGCSVAVVAGRTSYLIDFGPGLVRKAASLSPRYGGSIQALDITNLKIAFLTHLHSDHTTGLPDLILTPWSEGRDTPLTIYGPEGIQSMVKYTLKAYQEDIRYRIYGLQPVNNTGWKVNAHEIKKGLVYTDKNVRVEAFPVKHGSWPNAFGFRFTTPDKVIVISGDTAPCETLFKYGKNADILVHEVYYRKAFLQKDKFWQRYHAKNHTSTYELGEIAAKLKPKLLVLYHILFWGGSPDDLLAEIAAKYRGKVVVGSDLDVFE
jgi:ribonuclease Z